MGIVRLALRRPYTFVVVALLILVLGVEGIHFIQEDSPEKIGEALAAFVCSLRSL